MNSEVIITENLSKRYRIGLPLGPANGNGGFFEQLKRSLGNLASTLREVREQEVLWALRDVSLSVEQGEVVGLIGRNGAGKSTLLKILSRITEPTEGKALIRGRVGSLLEVGTGFHPELTGRENIFMNGSVLGMRRSEIDAKFDEIVAFSGIGRFIDTPVKRYSSGMSVRLAFSVAAHLQPEILLVDEVLAVGDAAFQKKCLGKMGDVAALSRTVLFVSHNMVAVQNICKRVIWLEAGRIVAEGQPDEIIARYLETERCGAREQSWDDMASAPGNDLVRLRRLSVFPVDGPRDAPIDMESPFEIEVEFWNLSPELLLDVQIFLHTDHDVIALSADTSHEPEWHGRRFPVGIFRCRCLIPGNWLNSGTYRVAVEIVKDGRRKVYVQTSDWLVFEVLDLGTRKLMSYGKQKGILRPRLKWATELVTRSVDTDPSLEPRNESPSEQLQ